jgi:hypothetical protein
MRSVTAHLRCTAGYVGVRPIARLADAPAPLRGESNLFITPDRASAAVLTAASLEDVAVRLEFHAVSRRAIKPMSWCPSFKASAGGNVDRWFGEGSAVGAWPIESTKSLARKERAENIRKWSRVPVEGGFRLQFELRPDRYICLRDGWFCLGPVEEAEVFSIELAVTVTA